MGPDTFRGRENPSILTCKAKRQQTCACASIPECFDMAWDEHVQVFGPPHTRRVHRARIKSSIQETVAYLQRLGAEDMDLICEYSRWVLESDQAAGLRVFTGAPRPAPPPFANPARRSFPGTRSSAVPGLRSARAALVPA